MTGVGGAIALERVEALRDLPTLVVSGELDRIARPESGRALAAAIPGARYVEHTGAGHAVPAYGPEPIHAILLEHLAAAGERSVARGPGQSSAIERP